MYSKIIASPANAASDRCPLLDGLRGIAAIAVMLYHAHVVFGEFSLFSRCYLLVDLFFILSGYVLTLSAEGRMNAANGSWLFLRARVKRLWPMVALGTLLGGALWANSVGLQKFAMLAVLALLMVPSPLKGSQIFPLNGPQWSLFVEVLCNLLHVLVLRHLRERGLAGVIIVSGTILVLEIGSYGSDTFGPDQANWAMAIPRALFPYALGVLLARNRDHSTRAPIVSWWLALALPASFVILLPILPVQVAIGDTAAALFVLPWMFWQASRATPPAEAHQWLCWLGALSFPLYALHLPLLVLASRISAARFSAGLSIISTVALAIWLAYVAQKRAPRSSARGEYSPRYAR